MFTHTQRCNERAEGGPDPFPLSVQVVIWLLNRLGLCLKTFSGGHILEYLPRAPSSHVTSLHAQKVRYEL